METGSLLLEPCDGLAGALQEVCGEDTIVAPIIKVRLVPRGASGRPAG
jgi:hypothetical protein